MISEDVFLRFFQLVLSDDAAELRVGPTLQKEIMRRANEKSLPSLKGDPNLHALADELLMYEATIIPPPSISENSVGELILDKLPCLSSHLSSLIISFIGLVRNTAGVFFTRLCFPQTFLSSELRNQ